MECVCAWCGAHLRWVAGGEGITHGICGRDLIRFMAQVLGGDVTLTDEQIDQLTDLYNELRDQGQSAEEASDQVDAQMREVLVEARGERAATVAA